MRVASWGRSAGLLVSVVGLCAAAAEPTPPNPLHLSDALAVFSRSGFDLLLADASVRSAAADVQVARALPNPSVNGSVGRSFHCPAPLCSQGLPLAWSAGISDENALSDLWSGKRGLRSDVASRALAAAKLSRADAERTLRAQVQQQFVQWLVASEARKVAEAALADSTQLVALTQVRFHAGAISEADVVRAQTDELEVRQGLDGARASETTARVGLLFLLGAREDFPSLSPEADGLLQRSSSEELKASDPTQLLAQARDNRADLRAARAQVQRGDASVSLAHRGLVPDVTVSLSYVQQGTGAEAITPPTYSLGLSLPLPLAYQQQGEIAKARADLSTQEIQLRKLDAQVSADVMQAYASYHAAQSQVTRMEGELLGRARRARDLVKLQYDKGAASLLELLDAERTYRTVQLEQQNDLGAYRNALFQLEAAIGKPLT